MEHLAIMKKSWRLTEKIIKGEKKIESRWYVAKRNPWNNIKKGETIYFKDSGEPVKIKAKISKVIQFSNLTPSLVRKLLIQYGKDDGIGREKTPEFFKYFKDKKYCLLVFLKNPKKIKPFEINKKGFGTMSAWITLENIRKIKKT